MGHEVELAEDGFQALSMIKLGFDLVLLDITMPGMDGFEVARRIREQFDIQELPICMVTGLTGREERLGRLRQERTILSANLWTYGNEGWCSLFTQA